MRKPEDINIIIGCEESQAICIEFRKRGFNAYSCDLLECSGGHPEWHIKGDVFKAINDHFIYNQLGEKVDINKWDMAIFHPPCTYLSVSGAGWMYHPEDKHLPYSERRPHPRHPNRRKQQEDGLSFVRRLMATDIPYALENPVSVISSVIRKPDQIIQPYMFGEEVSKATCLWLNKLPKLQPTDVVGKGERITFKSGKTMPAWYASLFGKPKSERAKMRSKTFRGIAEAIADQYGNYILTL